MSGFFGLTFFGAALIVVAIYVAVTAFRQNPKNPREGAAGAGGIIIYFLVMMTFAVLVLPTVLIYYVSNGDENWRQFVSAVIAPGQGGPGRVVEVDSFTRNWWEMDDPLLSGTYTPSPAEQSEVILPSLDHMDDLFPEPIVPGNDAIGDAPTQFEVEKARQITQWRAEMAAFRRVGDIESGKELLETILSTYPDHEWAQQVRREIMLAEARIKLRGEINTMEQERLQDVIDHIGPGNFLIVQVTEWEFRLSDPKTWLNFPTKWEEISEVEDMTEGWTRGDRFLIRRGHLSQLTRGEEEVGKTFVIGQE